MPDPSRKTLSAIVQEISQTLDRIDNDSAHRLIDMVLEAPAIFMAGSGRSGLLARCTAMRFMHMGLRVHIVRDTLTPPIGRGDLLLIASGSGETAGLIAMAKKTTSLDANIGLVTANPDSTLAGMAQVVVTIFAPTPKAEIARTRDSIQPMGSLFEQAMFLFWEAAVLDLMGKKGLTSGGMFARHANLE